MSNRDTIKGGVYEEKTQFTTSINDGTYTF